MTDAKRLVEGLAGRCVARVAFREHSRVFRPARRAINAEFRGVVAVARENGISPAAIAARVMDDLADRYGPDTAGRLHGEYLAAFTDDAQVNPVPS